MSSHANGILHQAKAGWESIIDASNGDSAIIEVQNWYARIPFVSRLVTYYSDRLGIG